MMSLLPVTEVSPGGSTVTVGLSPKTPMVSSALVPVKVTTVRGALRLAMADHPLRREATAGVGAAL